MGEKKRHLEFYLITNTKVDSGPGRKLGPEYQTSVSVYKVLFGKAMPTHLHISMTNFILNGKIE